jgi:hypothetical protein
MQYPFATFRIHSGGEKTGSDKFDPFPSGFIPADRQLAATICGLPNFSALHLVYPGASNVKSRGIL